MTEKTTSEKLEEYGVLIGGGVHIHDYDLFYRQTAYSTDGDQKAMDTARDKALAQIADPLQRHYQEQILGKSENGISVEEQIRNLSDEKYLSFRDKLKNERAGIKAEMAAILAKQEALGKAPDSQDPKMVEYLDNLRVTRSDLFLNRANAIAFNNITELAEQIRPLVPVTPNPAPEETVISNPLDTLLNDALGESEAAPSDLVEPTEPDPAPAPTPVPAPQPVDVAPLPDAAPAPAAPAAEIAEVTTPETVREEATEPVETTATVPFNDITKIQYYAMFAKAGGMAELQNVEISKIDGLAGPKTAAGIQAMTGMSIAEMYKTTPEAVGNSFDERMVHDENFRSIILTGMMDMAETDPAYVKQFLESKGVTVEGDDLVGFEDALDAYGQKLGTTAAAPAEPAPSPAVPDPAKPVTAPQPS